MLLTQHPFFNFIFWDKIFLLYTNWPWTTHSVCGSGWPSTYAFCLYLPSSRDNRSTPQGGPTQHSILHELYNQQFPHLGREWWFTPVTPRVDSWVRQEGWPQVQGPCLENKVTSKKNKTKQKKSLPCLSGRKASNHPAPSSRCAEGKGKVSAVQTSLCLTQWNRDILN